MTELYLIRHTQAEGNRYRMMQGHWDGDVTPLGFEQIRALSARFQDIPVDAVYSSDLTRAVLTAEGIARPKNLPVLTDKRLRELDLGSWESQFFGNIGYLYPAETEAFLNNPEKWSVPGSETMEDVASRAYAAISEIAFSHDGKTVAIVSHGITIRCLLSRILGLRLSGEELLPIFKNTSVTKLLYDKGTFTATTMGDASHAEALFNSDWVTLDALRDEIFDPAEDPGFYKACYEEAWQTAHPHAQKTFSPEPFFRAALLHHEACPGAVRRLYDRDTCVGIIDCDTQRGAHANYGWISFLYLIPSYRGKGYGIQALGRPLVLYRNLGRTSIRLHAASSNSQAIRFYEHCGFSTLSSEESTTGTVFLLEKKIGPPKS